ncbi:MAG: O-antigen ligase family protein [Actinomycetota bacterium]|nr:O-antigen ligase family protein [Actinomycetota bacterium]
MRLLRAGVLGGAFVTPATFLLLGGNAFGPPKAAVFAWSCAIVALAFLLDGELRGDIWTIVRSSSLSWAIAAFVAIAVFSTASSGRALAATTGGYPDYRGLLLILGCTVLGAGAAVLRRRGDVAWLWRTTSLLVAWVVVVAVGERLGLPPASLKLPGAIRTISTVGNASNLGVLLATMIPLAVGSALGERAKVWRALAFCAWAGGLVALVWTQSRGAWAGALVAVVVGVGLVLPGLRSRERSLAGVVRKQWMLLAATGVVALAVAAAATPGVIARVGSSFDASSSTAVWRLSTWRSAVRMTADRPVLGFGPDSFRLAYPAYKEPGQDDGRLGYVPTESAHNLMLDTSVSYGVTGFLAMIAAIGVASVVLVRCSLRSPSAGSLPAEEVAQVASALAGGFVALQFHYATLDTAPLFAVLLGLAVASQAGGGTAAARAPIRALAVASLALALLFAASGSAVVAVVAADSSAGRARALVAAEAPWSEIRKATEFAQRVAPWESAFFRAEGRAAGTLVSKGRVPEAADDGMIAYDAALELVPDNPVLMTERARLMLAVAIERHDATLAAEAGEQFARAAEIDPNSGIPLAGVGRAALVRRDFGEARTTLEHAVELSPLYAPAWADLGRTYRETGLLSQAEEAEGQAARLKASSALD